MTPEYNDIKSRISEEPTWYDDNGVPRDKRKGYTKEFTRILETYFPPDPKDKLAVRDKFHGWWAIDAYPIPFALFKDKAHAKAFMDVL